MKKYTNKSLNSIAPPPPYIRLLNKYLVVSPESARSLTQTFLAKIPKLALFSALWRSAAPLNCKNMQGMFFSIKPRRFFRAALGSCFSILLLIAALGLAHCSSDGNGGGGGGETTDTPTDPAGPTGPSCDTELLSTTMTTGSACTGGTFTVAGFGVIGGVFKLCDIMGGSISSAMFTLDGTDYTISAINYTNDSSDSRNGVQFEVGEDVPTDDLVLQLDSRELAFSDTRRVTGFTYYIWDDPSFSIWSDGQMVSVKLCVK